MQAPMSVHNSTPESSCGRHLVARLGHVVTQQESPRHVLWINHHADFVGGAEHYIHNTVRLLRGENVRATLMYEVGGAISPEFTRPFDKVFPIVNFQEQLKELDPDLLYMHKLHGEERAMQIAQAGVPVVRFFHDHELFCLREHKYTTVQKHNCSRRTGLSCYACPGFIRRSESWPGVRVAALGPLHREQATNRRYTAFVVASSYMADHLELHGFERRRIHTIPLYDPLPEIESEDPREDTELLFAGQLIRGKGLDILLHAMQRTGWGPCLLVAGSGRQEPEYRRLTRKLGIENRVRFLGRLNPDQLRARLKRATCLVIPSRAPETFGLIGLEAIKHATPVIATQVGGMGEWLHDESTGLAVPPGDADALAEAIRRMTTDKVLARRLGEQGRHLYWEKFVPQLHIEKLLGVFQQITRHGSRKNA